MILKIKQLCRDNFAGNGTPAAEIFITGLTTTKFKEGGVE